jgi:hypothetical protein
MLYMFRAIIAHHQQLGTVFAAVRCISCEVLSSVGYIPGVVFRWWYSPVCASETWTLSKINEWQLGLFERRVLRCIFGAKQENGTWRKRYNCELYEMFKDSDIVVYIKAKRLAWAARLTRMSDERTLKKIFSTKPDGTRSVGRPKLR